MKPRLIILVVAAGALAVYLAVAKNPASSPDSSASETIDSGMSADELAKIRDMQKTLDKFPLPGSEPADPPDVSVDVRVDTSEGKNRLYFTFAESHGYYVEQFRVQAWYKDNPDTDFTDAALSLEYFFDRYLKANDTLTECIEVVPAELRHIGGDIGTTDRWAVQLAQHGRARESNPEKFPARQPSTCGG